MRVNMRPSAAAVGAMLTEDEPCQIRATPTGQQASLSGDVLRAHDAYNEALAAAVGAPGISLGVYDRVMTCAVSRHIRMITCHICGI